MKVAIMQPYLFPYIGYFQLIDAADKFIFYDDVTFIRQGWIARNRILVNGEPQFFSVPLEHQSSFISIGDTLIHKRLFDGWKKKFFKTLSQSYSKANYFKEVETLVQKILDSESENISKLAMNSVKEICKYLRIEESFTMTSETGFAKDLHGEDRVMAICKNENATHYINLPGGESLYEKSFFEKENIQLQFIQTANVRYRQFREPFIPFLSIIDLLMFNSKDQVLTFIKDYTLK